MTESFDHFDDADAAPAADLAPGPLCTEMAFDAPEQDDDFLDAAGEAFGTFFVGQTELAFPAASVREVVPYPESVTSVPRSAKEVHGIFSLRGEVLPIVDLASVLQLDASGDPREGRVAVVEHGSQFIGVALDRTGEVIRPATGEVHRMDHEDQAGSRVIDGVIELADDGRFIQTLSADVLTSITGVPQRATTTSHEERRLEMRSFSKAIVFRVGEIDLALQIQEVLEIQADLEVSESPRYFDHCIGVVLLRGDTYPILDLRVALGLPAENPPKRYVFVELDGERVGLGVDALVETLEYPEDTLMPVPTLLASDVTRICSHVLQPGENRHVLVASVPALFQEFGVPRLSELLGYVGGADPNEFEDDEELGFFAFRVGDTTLCLPLDEVREVREIGEDVFSAGPSSGDVYGLMNLRGEVLPLLHAGERLGLGSAEASTSANPTAKEVALVVEAGTDAFGLVVDEIVDIRRTLSSKVSKTGGAEDGGSAPSGIMSYVRSTLLLSGEEGDRGVLVVLDGGKLAGAA